MAYFSFKQSSGDENPHVPVFRTALVNGLRRTRADVAIDAKGYVNTAADNLLDGVSLADFEDDLRQGDGNELAGKFRAAHSSSALAVNAFAPFKSCPSALRLPGDTRFSNLCFERKCPHGLAGRRSPNLDVFADAGADGVVAIESKCLEPMTPHTASFAPAYGAEIRDARRATPWFREMIRLTQEPKTYRWLDGAQLVKHAFGIAHSVSDRPSILLYLFWEPSNPDVHPFFAEHRKDVARFSDSVSGTTPAFAAMSYPELWSQWAKSSQPEWLQSHVQRLNARYRVAV